VAYWTVKALLTPLLRVLFRVRVEGREHVARSGPVILAANHRSFMDSIFLPLVLRRRVTFVAKAEYFDSRKTAWFFRAVGQIPIRREGGSASERALESAMDVLSGGGVFAIYPEGTRTRDGLLHRGHTGVARLALRAGVPIVPVGLVGTDEIQPTDAKLPRLFRRVTIRFGDPIEVARHDGRHDDRLVLRDLTDEVMFEIQALSGYEYVDTYATRSPEGGGGDVAKVVTLAELDRAPASAAS
jgi:1-acyl-sn-glycerol-3-phosphate acyltransferase